MWWYDDCWKQHLFLLRYMFKMSINRNLNYVVSWIYYNIWIWNHFMVSKFNRLKKSPTSSSYGLISPFFLSLSWQSIIYRWTLRLRRDQWCRWLYLRGHITFLVFCYFLWIFFFTNFSVCFWMIFFCVYPNIGIVSLLAGEADGLTWSVVRENENLFYNLGEGGRSHSFPRQQSNPYRRIFITTIASVVIVVEGEVFLLGGLFRRPEIHF